MGAWHWSGEESTSMSLFSEFLAAREAGDGKGAIEALRAADQTLEECGNTLYCVAAEEGAERVRQITETLEVHGTPGERAAAVAKKQRYGRTCTDVAICHPEPLEVTRALVEAGAPLPSLYKAACVRQKGGGDEERALALVRYLVEEEGADITAPNINGEVAIHGAAYAGNNSLVSYLVGIGADVNHVSSFSEETPLMVAAGEGHSNTAALLVSLGARLDIENGDGRTASQLARYHGFETKQLDEAEAVDGSK